MSITECLKVLLILFPISVVASYYNCGGTQDHKTWWGMLASWEVPSGMEMKS